MELIGLVAQIYKGAHVGHPKVRMTQARRVTASSPGKVVFQLDGDVAGYLPVTFEILPQALDVILPVS
jgi:diacylglycerol kinase (ATP)